MYGGNWGEGSWEGDKEGGNKKWKVKYSEHNSLFTSYLWLLDLVPSKLQSILLSIFPVIYVAIL